MATFVLVPGAGGDASYWDRLVGELERRGHRAVAVDIAQDDPALGLAGWAAVVDAAIPGNAGAGDGPTVLVAQSLGGFLAPLVTVPVQLIVLLNAMIPRPGESADEWWEATGSGAARRAADQAAGRDDPGFDMEWHFLHDLDEDARSALFAGRPREPSERAMADPCRFAAWPAVPTRVLVGAGDRFFPLEFQRRIARERLGSPIDVIPGGHLVAVSDPVVVAERLVGYLAGIE